MKAITAESAMHLLWSRMNVLNLLFCLHPSLQCPSASVLLYRMLHVHNDYGFGYWYLMTIQLYKPLQRLLLIGCTASQSKHAAQDLPRPLQSDSFLF